MSHASFFTWMSEFKEKMLLATYFCGNLDMNIPPKCNDIQTIAKRI